MKKSLLILLLFITIHSFSQCTKGNCINGIGTYDFGWCVYNGTFKNSKPDGKGTMKYDDYTFVGNFTNGLEDGDGIITNKNGTTENVKYENGIKQTYNLEKIAAKDYKSLNPHDDNCIDGDCVNGFGTYIYPSGNKYIGNRNNYKMEGNGTFYFADGEKFEGDFKNNLFANGTYTYKIGATYKGTYDDKGMELNGSITSVTGDAIPFVNGKAVIPPNPKVEYNENKSANKQNDTREMPIRICSCCNGRGKTHEVYLNGQRNSYGNLDFGGYTSCICCAGTGHGY